MITKETITSVKQVHSQTFGTWAYQVTGSDYKCSVPNDPDNMDYQKIQEWLNDGNQLLPADE